MRGRAIIPLVVGLGLGLLAVRSFLNVLSKAKGSTGSGEVVQVVRAATEITPMVAITAEMLETVELPKIAVPKGSPQEAAGLVGRVPTGIIPAGVPIVPSLLAPVGTLPGMSSRIQEGYRAVAVQVDEVAGVAGWLKPGSRVDVVLVTCGDIAGAVSAILLQNVEVLAVGQTIQADAGAKVTRSVTVLTTPTDASRLALASSKGSLRLTMRNAADRNEPRPEIITVRHLFEDKADKKAAKGGSLLAALFGKASSADKDKTDKDKATPPPVQVAAVQAKPEWVVDVLSGPEAYQLRFESDRAGARQTGGPVGQRAGAASGARAPSNSGNGTMPQAGVGGTAGARGTPVVGAGGSVSPAKDNEDEPAPPKAKTE